MNSHFRRYISVTAALGFLMTQALLAKPPKENPDTPKLGKEFKIKNISGVEVTVVIVERDRKQHIRSTYHHQGESELREYPISRAISSISISGSAINVFFSTTPGEKLAGAVYVINSHGEAVKVDDITQVDLTW